MEAPEPEEANRAPNIPLLNLITEFNNSQSPSRCKEICSILIDFIEDQPSRSPELITLSSVENLKVFAKGLQKEFDMKCLSNAPSAILNLISLLCDKECIDFQKIQNSNILHRVVLIVEKITEEFIHPKKMWGRDYSLTIESIWGWALKICSHFVLEFDEKSLIPTNNVLIFFHVKTMLDWFLEGEFAKRKYSHILPENFYDIICAYILKALRNRLYVELMNRLGLKSFFKFLKTKRDEAPEWIKNFDFMMFQILCLLTKEIADELFEAKIMFILNDYFRLNFDYLAQNRQNLHYTHLEVRNAYLLLIAQLIHHDQGVIQFHYLQMTRSLMYLNCQLGGNETLIHSICRVVDNEAYTSVQVKVQEGLKNPENFVRIRSVLERSSVHVGDLLDKPILEAEENNMDVQNEIRNPVEEQSKMEIKPPVVSEIEKLPQNVVEGNDELQSDNQNDVSKLQTGETEKEEGELDDDDSSLEFVGDIEYPDQSRESNSDSPEYSSGSPQYSSGEDINMGSYYEQEDYEDESEMEYSDNHDGPSKLDYEGLSDLDEEIDVEETKDCTSRDLVNYENNEERHIMKKEFPEKSRYSQHASYSSVDESDFKTNEVERPNELEIFPVQPSETVSGRQKYFAHQDLLSGASDYGNLEKQSEKIESPVEPELDIFPVQSAEIAPSKLPQISESHSFIPNDEHLQISSQNYNVRLCSSDYGGSSEDENNFIEECLEESFSKSMSAPTSTPNRSFECEIDRSYSNMEFDKSVELKSDLENDFQYSKQSETYRDHEASNFGSQTSKSEIKDFGTGASQKLIEVAKSDSISQIPGRIIDELEGQNESDSDVEFIDEWKECEIKQNKPVLKTEHPNSISKDSEQLDFETDSYLSGFTLETVEPSRSNLKIEAPNELNENTESDERFEASENSNMYIEAQNKTDFQAEEMKSSNLKTQVPTEPNLIDVSIESRLISEETESDWDEMCKTVSENNILNPSSDSEVLSKSDAKTEDDFIPEDVVGHMKDAESDMESKMVETVSEIRSNDSSLDVNFDEPDSVSSKIVEVDSESNSGSMFDLETEETNGCNLKTEATTEFNEGTELQCSGMVETSKESGLDMEGVDLKAQDCAMKPDTKIEDPKLDIESSEIVETVSEAPTELNEGTELQCSRMVETSKESGLDMEGVDLKADDCDMEPDLKIGDPKLDIESSEIVETVSEAPTEFNEGTELQCSRMVETSNESGLDMEGVDLKAEDWEPDSKVEDPKLGIESSEIVETVSGMNKFEESAIDVKAEGRDIVKPDLKIDDPKFDIESSEIVETVSRTDKFEESAMDIKAIEKSNFESEDLSKLDSFDKPLTEIELPKKSEISDSYNLEIETSTNSNRGNNTIESKSSFETTATSQMSKHSRKRMHSVFDLSDTSTPDESMEEATEESSSCSNPQAFPLDLHFKSPSTPESSPPKKLIKLSKRANFDSKICQRSDRMNTDPFSEIERTKLNSSTEESEDNMENVESKNSASAGQTKNESRILDLSTPCSSTEDLKTESENQKFTTVPNFRNESENAIEHQLDSKMGYSVSRLTSDDSVPDASVLLSDESVDMDLEISDDLDLISEPNESNLEPNASLCQIEIPKEMSDQKSGELESEIPSRKEPFDGDSWL